MTLVWNAGGDWKLAHKYSKRFPDHKPCTCERIFKSLTKKYRNPLQRLKDIINTYTIKEKEKEYGNIEKQLSFDFMNTYDVYDFKKEFNDKIYYDMDKFEDDIFEKLKSVCAYIIDIHCFIIKSNKRIIEMKCIKNAMPEVFLQGKKDNKKIDIGKYVIKNIKLNYSNIDYVLTLNTDNKIFNIWQGYDAKRIDNPDQEVIDAVIDVLYKVYCNEDKELLRYVLTWFSHIVSEPTITQTCLVLIEEKQGGGKGTFLELMEMILGEHCFRAISGINQLTQKHNTCLKGTRLLVMNEAASTRDEFRSNFDKLKMIITDKKIHVEPKGLEGYDLENIGNYIIVSNHADSLVIEDSDRRFQILECSDVYVNNFEFWGKWRNLCLTKNGADSFYTYLMNYNDKVNLRKLIDTPLKQEMKLRSLPNSVKFVLEYQEMLDRMEPDSCYQHLCELRAIDLYKKYDDWAKVRNEKLLSNTKFGLDIKKYVNKKCKKDGTYYIFQKNDDKFKTTNLL